MEVCVFIIFIVIQATACEKAIAKLQRKLMVPKMNDECKKIKCANVEEPQCVQMRRHNLTLTIHVIAANKCELQYVKCHDDVEAKIVPMKYCSHNATLTAGKKKTEAGKAHIRVKRQADKIRNASSQTNSELPSKLPLNNKLPESEESTHFPMISEEGAGLAEVDYVEYDEDCPTVCPARDVMVCGKCQHGIYKTFNSVCHMRMLSCKLVNEELELVSRKPCVFSAPYLSGRNMMPVGRITEYNDEDKILKFIQARDKGSPKENLKIFRPKRFPFPKRTTSSWEKRLREIRKKLIKEGKLVIDIDVTFCYKCEYHRSATQKYTKQ